MSSKIKTPILTNEVTRKEFLLYFGILILALTGVSGVLKNISAVKSSKSDKGFGSGSYGA